MVPADAARLLRRGRASDASSLGIAVHRRAHGVDPRIGGVAGQPRAASPAGGLAAVPGGTRVHEGSKGSRRPLKGGEAARRRELLRTAMGGVLDVLTIEEIATSLTAITD